MSYFYRKNILSIPNLNKLLQSTTHKPLQSSTSKPLQSNTHKLLAFYQTMASKKIFVSGPLIKPALDILYEAGLEVVMHDDYLLTEDDFVNNVKGIHGLYTFGPQKVTDRILVAAGPQLEVVSAMSVGVDSIDLKALKARNIKLGHTPGVLTDAVADIAVTLALNCSRKVIENYHVVKDGDWKGWSVFENLGAGLRHSTVGIVGLGRIGMAVGKRLIPFGVSKVLYTSRSEKQKEASEINACYVSLDELLAQSDFVICCCSLNEQSKELFSHDAFSKMKSNAIFVNIGRGSMVNQDALLDALTSNKIMAAGLDVTTPEPLPSDSPLLQCKNCIVLTHTGSATEETRRDMATMAARNLVAALKSESMPALYPL